MSGCGSEAEMTVEQRVLTALRRRQPDRVPVFLYLNPYADSEWYSQDPSYAGVLDACRRYADVIYDWYFPSGFFHTATPLEEETRPLADGVTEHVIHTPAGPITRRTQTDWRGAGTVKRWICETRDAERLLSLPYAPACPDLAPFRQARQARRGRWVTQVTLADPICSADLIDPTTLALWTVEERDLLRALLDAAFARIADELRYCLQNGAGPIYYFNGPEYALPPLMSPRDFEEFVVGYDRKLVDLVHAQRQNEPHCRLANSVKT